MDELKLYLVYHLGINPCWNLRVARSPEEALTTCFHHSAEVGVNDVDAGSCRVEEIRLEGYRIKIEKA
ncbi:MAG TPA: hypothetical protein PKI62_03620 [bacterium]|nr:hypothetical protein [bacterium]HPR88384.1 hypothetical protein [bacterium]